MKYINFLMSEASGEELDVLKKLESSPDDPAVKSHVFEIYKNWMRGGGTKLLSLSAIEEAVHEFSTVPVTDDTRADIFCSHLLYGSDASEYFQFRFYNLNDRGRSEYLCDQMRFRLFRGFYDFDRYELVRNKWEQYRTIGKYFKRDCIHLTEQDGNEEEFREFIAKHPVFIFKPVRSFGGNGVMRISTPITDSTMVFQRLCSIGGIADEEIHQDSRLAVFHNGSVNTVRIIALRGLDNQNHLFFGLFRMGRGNSVADNDSYAIRANLDAETGIVYTPGYNHSGKHYLFHPDTHRLIVGFQVPEWSGAVELINNVMAEISDYARYIGFDLSLTYSGWKIVEINSFPQMYPQQVADGKGHMSMLETLIRRCQAKPTDSCKA